MGSVWGNRLKLSVFGESHGEGAGVVIDGFPAGFAVDFEYIEKYLKRRAPGGGLVSSRNEPDSARVLSGLKNNTTTGAPICAFIENRDAAPSDYGDELISPRPNHADYTAYIKYKTFADHRGGGHFSARLTAPLVFAGALCADYLAREHNIKIGARIKRAGTLEDDELSYADFSSDFTEKLKNMEIPMISEKKAEALRSLIIQSKKNGDSIGAVVECFILNVPAGFGEHIFASAESVIASAVFGIPGVKGVEFGRGFGFGGMSGSEAADGFYYDSGGELKIKNNNNGGILGGITSGAPLVFSVAFKPAPSVFTEQDSVDLRNKTNVKLKTITGRHDPCIGLRGVPVVEAAAAAAVTELIFYG
ncbi:MAG: chorismate synthase [Oscillospiraceae bacterium]|nr:chorismate synthase [Oscillospiraceae bacterium]